MSKRAEEAALKAYPPNIVNLYGEPCDAQAGNRQRFIQGYEQAKKELIPLINRLCEAILFEWEDAAELARKTLTQIKDREGEK